ncbi:hypothetical protein BC829DRAFT_444040 [Chytridium lagenaria]|nr:hypothetical protein BC829DRAFT_444040 [Chytridium lagenaria]
MPSASRSHDLMSDEIRADELEAAGLMKSSLTIASQDYHRKPQVEKTRKAVAKVLQELLHNGYMDYLEAYQTPACGVVFTERRFPDVGAEGQAIPVIEQVIEEPIQLGAAPVGAVASDYASSSTCATRASSPDMDLDQNSAVGNDEGLPAAPVPLPPVITEEVVHPAGAEPVVAALPVEGLADHLDDDSSTLYSRDSINEATELERDGEIEDIQAQPAERTAREDDVSSEATLYENEVIEDDIEDEEENMQPEPVPDFNFHTVEGREWLDTHSSEHAEISWILTSIDTEEELALRKVDFEDRATRKAMGFPKCSPQQFIEYKISRSAAFGLFVPEGDIPRAERLSTHEIEIFRIQRGLKKEDEDVVKSDYGDDDENEKMDDEAQKPSSSNRRKRQDDDDDNSSDRPATRRRVADESEQNGDEASRPSSSKRKREEDDGGSSDRSAPRPRVNEDSQLEVQQALPTHNALAQEDSEALGAKRASLVACGFGF